MQRRMKLIRKLLEYVEMSATEERLPIPEFQDYSEAEVHYHLTLCEEADYLIPHPPQMSDSVRRPVGISRLTWAGHQALDAMRTGEDL